MSQLVYGVWEGKPYDFRSAPIPAGTELPRLEDLEDFDPGNPVKAFIADRGFLVFDASVSLIGAFQQYISRAAESSCGKCTPCRAGTAQIRDQLESLERGESFPVRLNDIGEIARILATSSLCGLGQTCARALLDALTHFRDVFEREIALAKAPSQHSTLYMTAPCIEACPAKLDVPKYIDCIKDGRPDYALRTILEKYPLAASCGRVCVRFCESACRRQTVDGAVGIKMLKRFVADQAYPLAEGVFPKNLTPPANANKKRVAVVGAGPAGVTCAYHLLLNGVAVEVFEAQQTSGGMASVGIPSYRLPKDVLKAETEGVIKRLGGKVHYGKRLGQDISVDGLLARGFDSVFLAFGCSKGGMLGIQNETPTPKGYSSGIDFLLDVHKHVECGEPVSLEGEVVVVGGGNVAMDCVRSALRLGAKKVHLVYRRTREDMPADHEEIEACEKEGVVMHFLCNPSRLVVENGRVIGVDLVQMRQTDADEEGRRNVEAIAGTEAMLACTHVFAAIGQQIDRRSLALEDGIRVDRKGIIAVNPETLETSRPGVFAGGDCVLGALTLIHAMDHGSRAAAAICQYLEEGRVSPDPESRMQAVLANSHLLEGEVISIPQRLRLRASVPELEVEQRVGNFDEVELAISKGEAYHEAERCLRCYRLYSVVTAEPFGAVAQATL